MCGGRFSIFHNDPLKETNNLYAPTPIRNDLVRRWNIEYFILTKDDYLLSWLCCRFAIYRKNTIKCKKITAKHFKLNILIIISRSDFLLNDETRQKCNGICPKTFPNIYGVNSVESREMLYFGLQT